MNLTQEPDAPMLTWQVIQGEFKEHRMPYFFEFRGVGTTISDRNLSNYPYTKELKLSSRSAYGKLMRQIAFNSWRSIGLQFFASENKVSGVNPPVLLQIGNEINVYIIDKDVVITLQTATIRYVEKRFFNVIDDTNSKPNYLFINCKRDGGQTQAYPNRITFAVGKSEDFITGKISIGLQGNNVTSYTTAGSQPVFTASDSAEISLGDKNGVFSAFCTIGALRLFDYEMTIDDIQRDIRNDWKMKFL
jgi:hypothetical protein